ncbi:MAG: Asp-tRNA(Asn)/Glu-tRNA(Gln) amidotransferase subunit GatC [Patescibacteria group bacterium]|nr:Asp-tRNA(Asn)/Glu-tRNA(Gln) amidotransferase subunit GatC [Patescibacteria group bacterium]
MVLSKKEIIKIADLAKLNLSDKEAAAFGRELADVLGYVNKINQLDLSQVEQSLSGAQQNSLFLRADSPQFSKSQGLIPAKNIKAGFVAVPNVFNKKND